MAQTAGSPDATLEDRNKANGLPAGYKRSSYAVPEDVHKALPGVVTGLGLRSVAALLTLVARSPEAQAALKEPAAKFAIEQRTGSTTGAKKELRDRLKDMTPAEVTRLLQLADQLRSEEGAQS